jgi:hypothetical protein
MRDGLARIRPVRGVWRLQGVTSGRRPGDIGSVIVTGNELASVVPPSKGLQLLRRDVRLVSTFTILFFFVTDSGENKLQLFTSRLANTLGKANKLLLE